MSDSISIALRFVLYVDLMLLFGVALFGLYSLKGQERLSGAVLPFRPMLAGTAVLGVVLSVASMVMMASAMSGESDFAELRPHIEMMLFETNVGLGLGGAHCCAGHRRFSGDAPCTWFQFMGCSFCRRCCPFQPGLERAWRYG